MRIITIAMKLILVFVVWFVGVIVMVLLDSHAVYWVGGILLALGGWAIVDTFLLVSRWLSTKPGHSGCIESDEDEGWNTCIHCGALSSGMTCCGCGEAL